nr:hypothetical protein [uncultured Acetatifactor sp.]
MVVCIFFFLGFKKDVWFCDEVYSYTSANANGIKQNIFSYENEWIKGEAVTAYFSANDYKLNFQNIADSLYTDHVPLYFWLLRIVSIINMGSCSKWGGLGINLIFYCMLYIALWIFFERTGELNSLTHLNILLAVVTILVHSTTLSEALMIRMYLMFSLFQIVFCLYLIKRYAFWTDDFTIISCNARVIDTFLLLDMVGPFFSSLFGLFGDCDTESKKQVECNGKIYWGNDMCIVVCNCNISKLVYKYFFNTSTKGYSSLSKVFSGGSLTSGNRSARDI